MVMVLLVVVVVKGLRLMSECEVRIYKDYLVMGAHIVLLFVFLVFFAAFSLFFFLGVRAGVFDVVLVKR